MSSELAIYELASGQVKSILKTDRLIEAPNWTTDGLALIINGDGRLYRVDLDVPTLDEIDTGFARLCNNDHGISPDGQSLVISDSTESGESQLYVLPIGGGTPRKVTQNQPCFWHGWSPDGRTLAYVGKRGGPFDVFTISLDGGDEKRLTDGFDHTDGPDYTPDGEWIWFNGERDGAVDLWRMHHDGSALQQMTFDADVNWFPHPSPDGSQILYLAYPPGTEGHPRDLDVELRVMPADGGEARTLVKLFGGQGSINVPCWSPDGTAFAFMQYRRA